MIYEKTFSFEKIFQCDIFKNTFFSCEKERYYAIILTPSCDLIIQKGKHRPKAHYLKFAGIVDFLPVLNNIFSQLRISKRQISGEEYIDESTFNKLQILLRQFIRGSYYPRYYYLPPLDGYYGHSIIDFQLIETKKSTESLIQQLLENKISSLKSSWKESIPVRYSSYFSRIGVDDITEEIISKVFIDFGLNFNRSS